MSAVATGLVLAIGLGTDSPAVVNPLVTSTPVLVLAAYAVWTKISHAIKKE